MKKETELIVRCTTETGEMSMSATDVSRYGYPATGRFLPFDRQCTGCLASHIFPRL